MIGQSIKQAALAIKQAGVVIYPTEGVYGLGCDFRNQQAVQKLLSLKQRPISQGLILVASHIQQILPLIKPTHRSHLARALKTWPGHSTWVFPSTPLVPNWISGEHQSVAVRLSNHDTVISLCNELDSAVVSTSANINGQTPMDNCLDLFDLWGSAVDYYLDLPLGGQAHASSIRQASDGKVLR